MSKLQPVEINPPPGVVLTETDKVAVGRYTASNMCRFIRAKLQKRGGWIAITTTPTMGTPRECHSWRDNSANQYFAIGTFEKLYAYDTSWVQSDITPFRIGAGGAVTLGNNPLSTVITTPTVTVVHASHGLGVGDFIIIAGSAAIGGITPNGTFNVATVIDANTYTFAFTSNATGTVNGGGGASVTVQYEINIGTELGAFGYGYGVSGYGLGGYGNARSSSNITIEPRIWSLDHFGKFLLATYNGGALYQFDPTAAQPWPRAAIITNAPTDIRAMFVTPEQFVIALRANMVIHGCSQGDDTTWTPATNNTAFTRTLTIGTKLVAGRVLSPFNSLVWSDSAIYLLRYTGSSFVYDSMLLGAKCGLVGPNAAVTVGGVAYWMSADNFWMFDGSVHPMPNVEDVRKTVFDALNVNNSYQCHAVYNPRHNEIEFFYTISGQTNPTLSVFYSIDDKAWAPNSWGTLCRASGTSPDQGDTRPLMCGTDGLVYQHENGNDANGSALSYSWQIARYSLGDGFMVGEMQGIETDFNNMAKTMTLTVSSYDRLYDGAVQTEPLETDTATITTSEGYFDFRVSGRYIQLSGASSDVGSYFRMGKPVAYVKPIGIRTG